MPLQLFLISIYPCKSIREKLQAMKQSMKGLNLPYFIFFTRKINNELIHYNISPLSLIT